MPESPGQTVSNPMQELPRSAVFIDNRVKATPTTGGFEMSVRRVSRLLRHGRGGWSTTIVVGALVGLGVATAAAAAEGPQPARTCASLGTVAVAGGSRGVRG